jgi:hypothetical protein
MSARAQPAWVRARSSGAPPSKKLSAARRSEEAPRHATAAASHASALVLSGYLAAGLEPGNDEDLDG